MHQKAHRFRRRGEGGFTLVELFVVIATIGVLAAISIQTFTVYRQSSYDSHADMSIVNAKTALQAGLSDMNEQDTQNFYALWTNADGSFGGFPDTGFAPGLQVDDQVRVAINYDGWCDSADTSTWCPPGGLCCITQWYQAYHCKGKLAKSYSLWNNGTITEFEFAAPGC